MLFPFSRLTLLKAGFFFLLGLLVISCYQRTEHFDDAWFAEQSYWLVRDGWVRSELFRGLNGWEDRIYVFHKLYIYASALVMSLIGFSLPASKLLTTLCALTTGYLIWRYNQRSSALEQWLALLLYAGCGIVIQYIAVNRPEMMCALLGFSSYYVLSQRTNQATGRPGLAGLLAGMAALTHLNGLIYVAAGLVWLLVRDGLRPAIRFAIVSGLTLSLYTVDALWDGQISLMISQFIHDPATQANFSLADKWRIMLDYHQLFFHGYAEVPLSVLVLLCLLAGGQSARLSNPTMLYLLVLVVSFWLLTKSNFDFYYILFAPWLALVAANVLTDSRADRPRWQRRAGVAVVVAYYGLALFTVEQVLVENRTVPYMPHYNAMLAQHMPRKHTRIIAPIGFFFDQMETYHIHGLSYYSARHGHASLAEFFQLADQQQATYVVSDGYENASYVIPLNAPERVGAYKRIFRDQMTSIYERQ
ncbi:glycosyltransferase family 39 protein [uncultured Spirosoma sp.]|uniref:glycosyltransferase family 39 protein n=1 Tax=uncultured Spirosoma sp. TaxID=278208 RepID=UPI00258E736F|nr:glycosyltransferase family 39 protein [uncultured Spirosoma sp.]